MAQEYAEALANKEEEKANQLANAIAAAKEKTLQKTN